MMFFVFQPFLIPPNIVVTPSHQTLERPQDALVFWIEDFTLDNFTLCVRETKIFAGLHENIRIVSFYLIDAMQRRLIVRNFKLHLIESF